MKMKNKHPIGTSNGTACSHDSMHLRLAQARQLLFGKPSCASLNRWCAKGLITPNGNRVVLKSKFCGRVRYTSMEAIEEFLQATNPPSYAEAEAELETDGL